MATQVVSAEGASGRESSASGPFAPSWLDAIVAGIERLPGPTWAAYLVMTGFAFAYVALEAALSSRGLFGQDPAYFAYAIFHVTALAAYHFLSLGGRSAWDAFRPAVDYDDATSARRRAELSTTPAWPAVAVYVVAALAYMALLASSPEGFDLVGHQPAFVVVRVAAEAFWLAPVTFMVGYLLMRQVRIVSRLHRSVATVDLLEPGPLHAMARLTARSAIVLILVQLLVFVPLPNMTDSARLTLILVVLPFIGLSAAAFFVPLRGMQSRLDQERSRLKSAVNARIKATMAALHEVVDDETQPGPRDADAARFALVRIDALNMALASLLQEREFIGKLSSWPWDTSTLRAVISAIALPIALFVLTTAIDRFLI